MPQTQEQIQMIRAAAIKEGYSPEQVESFLLSKGLVAPNSSSSNINIKSPTSPAAPVEASVESGWPKTVISSGLGILTGMGIAGTGVGLPLAGIAGSAVSSLSDALIDKYMNAPTKYPLSQTLGITEPGKELSGSPIANTLASAFEGTVMNEALGAMIGYPLKKGGNAILNIIKEADAAPGGNAVITKLTNVAQTQLANLREKAINLFGTPSYLSTRGKGSVSGALSEFNPTFTQYADKPHHLAEAVENIFARKQKEQAATEAAAAGIEHVENKLSNLVGRKVSLKDADLLTNRMQKQAEANYENLYNTITDTQEALKLVNKGSAAETRLKSQLTELTDAMALFVPRGEKGLGLKNLIQVGPPKVGNIHYPTPIINSIVDDAQKMQRFLDSGEIKVGSKVITSASGRKDLQGYQFMRLINDAYDTSNDTININKLLNSWDKYKITDMGKKLYNSQNKADVDQLFKNLQKIGIGENTPGASRYLTLKLGTGVAALGSGVVTGMLGGKVTGLGTAGTIVGMALGLNQLGKLMTDKNTARLMIAMASNGPLEMSPKIAGRIIARALRNEPTIMQLKDSSSGKIVNIEGKLDNLGKFEANLGQ